MRFKQDRELRVSGRAETRYKNNPGNRERDALIHRVFQRQHHSVQSASVHLYCCSLHLVSHRNRVAASPNRLSEND